MPIVRSKPKEQSQQINPQLNRQSILPAIDALPQLEPATIQLAYQLQQFICQNPIDADNTTVRETRSIIDAITATCFVSREFELKESYNREAASKYLKD